MARMTEAQEKLARQLALEAASYLRDEADFNRSWTDGRRGDERTLTSQYIAHRLDIAKQREAWAHAIELLIGRRALTEAEGE